MIKSAGTYKARLTIFSMTGAAPLDGVFTGIDGYMLDHTTGSPATINYHTFGDCLSLDGDPDISFAAAPAGWTPTSVNIRPTPPTGGSVDFGHVQADTAGTCVMHGEASVEIVYGGGFWTYTTAAPGGTSCTVQYPVQQPYMPDPTSLRLQSLLSATMALVLNTRFPRAVLARLLEVYGTYDIVLTWWVVEQPTPDLPIGNVKAVATSNVASLAGVGTIGGFPAGVVLVAGDPVRVPLQTNPCENGIWIVAGGRWTRAADMCGNPVTQHLVLSASDPGSPCGTTFDPLDPNAAPTPVIILVTPDHGPLAGGTPIVIEGSGFGDGCSVTIDGVPCTDLVVVSSSRLTCTTPAHVAGLENVVVTNEDGVSS